MFLYEKTSGIFKYKVKKQIHLLWEWGGYSLSFSRRGKGWGYATKVDENKLSTLSWGQNGVNDW